MEVGRGWYFPWGMTMMIIHPLRGDAESVPARWFALQSSGGSAEVTCFCRFRLRPTTDFATTHRGTHAPSGLPTRVYMCVDIHDVDYLNIERH